LKQELVADKAAVVQYWPYFNDTFSFEKKTFRKTVYWSGRNEMGWKWMDY